MVRSSMVTLSNCDPENKWATIIFMRCLLAKLMSSACCLGIDEFFSQWGFAIVAGALRFVYMFTHQVLCCCFFVVVTRISHISQYYHVPIDSNHRENLEEYWIFLGFFFSWKWCTTPYPANKWQKIIINNKRWYWLSQRQLPYTAIAKERKE